MYVLVCLMLMLFVFFFKQKTAYEILKRYNDVGLEGLTDRSRRPYRHANQLPVQIETLIVRCKQDKPNWADVFASQTRHGFLHQPPKTGGLRALTRPPSSSVPR